MSSDKANLDRIHWSERWEIEAERTFNELSKLSDEELIARINRHEIDPYYQIWRVIGEKCRSKKTVTSLIEFLKNHPGKEELLNRTHCATALFQIINRPQYSQLKRNIQWDHDGEERRLENIEILKMIASLSP